MVYMLNKRCLLSIKFYGVSLLKGLHTSLDTFLNDPFFIQALKDFESLGFIKIKKEGIEILDHKGIENYLKNFGQLD